MEPADNPPRRTHRLNPDAQEHPENDLHSAADYANKARPVPETLEEWAEQPDPAEVNARNEASTRQAIYFAAGSVAATFLVGGIIAIASRLSGGPLCASGEATWLCTQGWRNAWAILSSIVPIAALIGCAVIMVRKLNRYERWMPWMGVFWLIIVPLTMIWLTMTVGMLALDYS